jgi:hypothetical protein
MFGLQDPRAPGTAGAAASLSTRKFESATKNPEFPSATKFLNVFMREGCKMVEMSCAEYDKHAAGSQFITHTMGRVLEMLSEKRGREGERCGCRGKGEDRSEMREKKLKE